VTASAPIALLISDIDGTLVTDDKVLTPRSVQAAAALARAGVGFTLISSRPPRGMAGLVGALGVSLPFAAYNGAALVADDGRPIVVHALAPAVARQTLSLLAQGGVDAWVFAGDDWLLLASAVVNVERERRTVGFDPTVVAGFDAVAAPIGKIVGVSADPARLDACEANIRAALGARAAINRSQSYYLDISDPHATKGQAVASLCELIGVPLSRTAVMGDMFNDVSMFEVAGLAIAMGQAPDAVKARAAFVTASNANDGFAAAVEAVILPRAAKPAS
jgi:hypothetical protein